MKKLFITLFILSFTNIWAQEKPNKLFQLSEHWGGYGGVTFTVNTADNLSLSGEGAWLIRNFYIGGHGSSSDYGNFISNVTNRSYNLKRDMGGFMLGAVSNTESKFALYAELRFGFGEIKARTELAPHNFEEYDRDAFVFIPAAGITFTPISFIQLRAFAGFETMNSFNMVGITDKDVQGFVFGAGLYLGYF